MHEHRLRHSTVPVMSLWQWSLPSDEGYGFHGPIKLAGKNLPYKHLACEVLLKNSVLIPVPKKQSEIISKATQVPYVRVTRAFKTVEDSANLGAESLDLRPLRHISSSLLLAATGEVLHGFCLPWLKLLLRARLHALGTSIFFLKARKRGHNLDI